MITFLKEIIILMVGRISFIFDLSYAIKDNLYMEERDQYRKFLIMIKLPKTVVDFILMHW